MTTRDIIENMMKYPPYSNDDKEIIFETITGHIRDKLEILTINQLKALRIQIFSYLLLIGD